MKDIKKSQYQCNCPITLYTPQSSGKPPAFLPLLVRLTNAFVLSFCVLIIQAFQ